MVKKAVNHIVFANPFFGALLMQQNIKEDNSKRTFYVNGKDLGYNYKFADTLSFDEIGGILIHELYHLIFLHHIRLQGRNLKIFNKAADYAINIIVIRAGFKLPENALLDYKYDNMTAEEIYRVLMIEEQKKQEEEDKSKQDKKSDDKEEDKESDKDDSESDDKEPDDSDKDEESDEDGDKESDDKGGDEKSDEESDNKSDDKGNGDKESDEDGDGDGDGDKESDKEGNGNGNGDSDSDSDSNNESDDPSNFGGIVLPDDITEAEENIKVQTKKAMIIAKQAGQMPGDGIIKMIEDAQAPVYDWVELLNEFIVELAQSDYNFEHADDRFLNRGVILPTLNNEAIGNIVFAVDTSGSVTTDEVRQLVDEIRNCLDIVTENKGDTTLTVIYCDSMVQSVDILDGAVKPNPKGGGGTRFDPVFRYIQDNDIEPDALFYITDGYGYTDNFVGVNIEYPVKWCLTTQYKEYVEMLGFGDVIILNDLAY